MSILNKLSKNNLKEFLLKEWMTHDAMWLYHCLQECGPDLMNKINQAAVKSMASIEIRRIKKILGITKDKIDSYSELQDIILSAMELVKGDFMRFSHEFRNDNILYWNWENEKCFAYEGIRDLGILDKYECGILLRIEAWFEALGIKYEVNPKVGKCIMRIDGNCSGEFKLFF